MLGERVSRLHLFRGWGTGITGSEELGEGIPPNMIAVPSLENSSVLGMGHKKRTLQSI